MRASYIMPLAFEQRGGRAFNANYPKYLFTSPPANCEFFTLQPYAFANLCIVTAEISPENHTIVKGMPDVWSIPENANQTMPEDQLLYFKAWVNLFQLPTDGLTVGMTYNALMRYISNLIQFSQYADHQKGLGFQGRNLNVPFGDLSTKDKSTLDQVYVEKGYSKKKFNNNATLNEVLQTVGEAGTDIPVLLGEVTF